MIADESSPAVNELERGLGFSGRWSRDEDNFRGPGFATGVEMCGFNADVGWVGAVVK